VWQPCELLYTCYYTDGPWPHDPFTCSAHPLILRRLHLAVSVQHRSGVRPSSHVSVCSVEQILNATLEESAVARPAYVAALLCEGWGSKPTAVGRSQLLARWPGTHSRILSGLQRAAQTVLGVYLKRTCSRVTSASSVLAVLSDYALYKSTHSLTHSLTVSKRGYRPTPHPTPSHLVRRPVPTFSRRDNYSTSGRNVAKGRRHVAHAVDDVGREAATAAAAAAADSRRMINGKSRIEFASVKRVSDTYSVQRPLERRLQR